ncbi:hypothetical protein [Bradyrhizobium sp. USDA 3364]
MTDGTLDASQLGGRWLLNLRGTRERRVKREAHAAQLTQQDAQDDIILRMKRGGGQISYGVLADKFEALTERLFDVTADDALDLNILEFYVGVYYLLLWMTSVLGGSPAEDGEFTITKDSWDYAIGVAFQAATETDNMVVVAGLLRGQLGAAAVEIVKAQEVRGRG